jgi:two-component system OmpR family response regulator
LRVLVVEDSVKVARLLERGLGEEGFAVDVAHTGADAVWIGREHDYDAIVLDVGLPDLDGFDVCKALREAQRWSPVLMLTARDAVEDRVRGLDCGADDYLVKPFAFVELVARLRALIRRGSNARPTCLTVGDLTLDPSTHRVARGGSVIALSSKEFALLEYFMRHPDEVIARSRLIDHAWDFAFDGDPHIVTVYIGLLRDKIDRPFGCASLETIRGTGYRLRDDRVASPPD